MVGASAEDAEAAERSPLQLPESLIPEQVSIDVIREEQRNDPFSIDLLSQLEKLPDGEVVTQADGRTKSGRALRLSKFAALLPWRLWFVSRAFARTDATERPWTNVSSVYMFDLCVLQ